MVHLCPKIVGIAGQALDVVLRAAPGAPPPDFEWIELPPILEPAPGGGAAMRHRGPVAPEDPREQYALALRARRPGRGVARARLGGAEVRIPAVVFRPREFFLCMAISSNYHYGWDPLCYLFGGGPEQLELEGDAWLKTRQLEKMYHMRGLPITWFVDEKVAARAGESIARWHLEYGDDYGVMPTSYIHHCAENYNLTRTADQVTAFMRETLEKTQARFDFYTTTFAVDQFIGSVGSHFNEGAWRLGLQGLWGVGFDHRTCDTSMYHRGCPWDLYKPARGNFRIPSPAPSRLWMYQWTTRDAWLSLHSPDAGPSGAVIFSTDPDDARCSRILFEQPGYWEAFFRGYLANFPDCDPATPPQEPAPPPGLNDVFCFLMHQEDHDCGFPENADLLRTFLDGAAGLATPATLEEVNAWLNLRFAPEEAPAQALWLEDHLRCHEKVVWYAGVQKPADFPREGETYPPGVAFYDRHVMWCARRGEPLPWRWFDYAAQTPVAEGDVLPEANPRDTIQIRSMRLEREGAGWRARAELRSPREFARLPLLFWGALPGREGAGRPAALAGGRALAIRDCLAVWAHVREGENAIDEWITLDDAAE